MKPLKIGVIGCGRRVGGLLHSMGIFGDDCRVAAIVDPRSQEIIAADKDFFKDTRSFPTPEAMMEEQELDGVMIGTHCNLHTEMACRIVRYGVPLFLEKPVAITFEQLKALQDAFASFTAPVVVSFPLRVSALLQEVKAIIDRGEIGDIAHLVAFNDVPYALGYYTKWYRTFAESGGLFLQKATHDLDYVNYLLGRKPVLVCAMNARMVYGGDKPTDLCCRECDEQRSCPESPFNDFYQGAKGEGVDVDSARLCAFSEAVEIEDVGNCIVEYEGGVQASYTQNFIARNKAARRGARLYGNKGTLEFDWYKGQIKVFSHSAPLEKTVDFGADKGHFGGDVGLIHDFLQAMKDGSPGRAPLAAGILSALTCLCARESAQTKTFQRVTLGAAGAR